ncbi:MAG: sensor histidine kinase [Zymomonas mobilis]|uniref:sensor histidine kinase n=1 Tax=Zymomonas mobilis TaxID=542 RepID=UPI0039E81B4F
MKAFFKKSPSKTFHKKQLLTRRLFLLFVSMPTWFRMLVVLSLAQLPPSFVALGAFIASSHQYRLNHQKEAQLIATESARTIDDSVDILAYDVRNIFDEEGSYDFADMGECSLLIQHMQSLGFVPVDYALMDTSGRLLCKSDNFKVNTAVLLPFKPIGENNFYNVDILDNEGQLQFSFLGGHYPLSKYLVVGQIGRDSLLKIIERKVVPDGSALFLAQKSHLLPLISPKKPLLKQSHPVVIPTFDNSINLIYDNNLPPFRKVDLLFVLLPVLIWFMTASIGWVVVHYMLLRPLRRTQRAIVDYGKTGEIQKIKPASIGAAREIRQVSKAFYHVAVRLAAHERALRNALQHQKMLTREVHHRVKNNLQVVSSLLSIHSRRAETAKEKSAYATIQRRVNALAIVQRQYYNELDKGQGLDLSLLIKELVNGLQTSLQTFEKNFQIETEIDQVFVPLEKAMPIAFILVEIVDFSLAVDPLVPITIILQHHSAEFENTPDHAGLEIRAEALKQLSSRKGNEVIRRIISAFGRQLGGKSVEKEEDGYYYYDIDILPD